ncbi:MAG: glycine zipper 2TM domain-containing protein [Pseudomonadota bacterium]
MENTTSSKRMHPLIGAAAVSVIIASLVGVAAMAGLFPNSHGTVAPAATIPATPVVVVSEPVPTPPKARVAAAPETRRAPQQSQDRTERSAASSQVARARSVCENCGTVESVDAIRQAAQPSGLGIAAGAVVGGLLGNQVGGGNGKTLATVAGVVGGGFAGNEVEKRTRSTTSYEVRVRMQDGSARTFPSAVNNAWQVGDRVRVVNGALTAQG